MPTYEYRCKTCGEHLEVVQSFKDDSLTDCPACGASGQLRKVFGSIGITFKGSGFYRTDSRASSSSTAKKDDTKTDAKTTTGDSSSSGSDSSTPPKSSSKASTSSTSAA